MSLVRKLNFCAIRASESPRFTVVNECIEAIKGHVSQQRWKSQLIEKQQQKKAAKMKPVVDDSDVKQP